MLGSNALVVHELLPAEGKVGACFWIHTRTLCVPATALLVVYALEALEGQQFQVWKETSRPLQLGMYGVLRHLDTAEV